MKPENPSVLPSMPESSTSMTSSEAASMVFVLSRSAISPGETCRCANSLVSAVSFSCSSARCFCNAEAVSDLRLASARTHSESVVISISKTRVQIPRLRAVASS
ncbi:MAG: hypothetical protein AW09_000644 [Candidatus Accumulibacter phosphatis]|uniref:Uncharacterized protein n=1 Tax=Candidatus Accumulibacter phosphatis TaxID=327160 RepID=A0A080LZ73_9PROT|nr:MAG: hypothetical protein AW09_000644 [Candidatus Accumulibacter phosphatis]